MKATTLRLMHRATLRSLHQAMLASEEAVEMYRGAGVSAERIFRYHVPIDTERFRPGDAGERARLRASLGLPADARIILSVSRLTPEKGIEKLIEAVEALPAAGAEGTLLVIAGDGWMRPGLEERAAGSPFAIRLTGSVPADELPGVLRSADLFVYAALQGSNVPVSTLEAMASGLPVVATTEPIAHTAIQRYLDDPGARTTAGGLARRYVEEQHAGTVLAQETDRFLELLQSPSTSTEG